MAVKVNASSQGGGEFKQYIGVGSFKVLGVNPTKEELSKFYGREVTKDVTYITDKTDAEGKPYKSMRISFMIQADDPSALAKELKETIATNANLTEPLKTTINFFIDSRYFYKTDKSKVKVIDKYGRTAWVPVEQCKNHQIPVYANGPARLDKDYKPLLHGEEELTNFISNYLNVTPIESYNRNTGTWIPSSNPEDCEINLYKIKDYFKGDVSELKDYCKMGAANFVKIRIGVSTSDDGKQYQTAYSRRTMRNGSKSYTTLKDSVDNDNQNGRQNETYSDNAAGVIENLHVYSGNNVKETDLSKPVEVHDPFAEAAALPEDNLPFGDSNNDDPFSDVA